MFVLGKQDKKTVSKSFLAICVSHASMAWEQLLNSVSVPEFKLNVNGVSKQDAELPFKLKWKEAELKWLEIYVTKHYWPLCVIFGVVSGFFHYKFPLLILHTPVGFLALKCDGEIWKTGALIVSLWFIDERHTVCDVYFRTIWSSDVLRWGRHLKSKL